MKSQIQIHLSKFEETISDPLWVKSPNIWVRSLGPSTIKQLGRTLAQKIFGGKLVNKNELGYDLQSNGRKIAVKLSTLSTSDSRPTIAWKNFHPDDDYSHACFIVIYPTDTRIFLVPKENIPQEVFRSHGIVGKKQTFTIATRKINELFSWMTAHEIFN